MSSPYVCMSVILIIPNEYDFLLILNSYVCRIRYILAGCGRTIPKWNNPYILLWVWADYSKME